VFTAGGNLISKHGTRVLTTATVDSQVSAVGIPGRGSPFYRHRAVERVPLLASRDSREDSALLAIGTVESIDGRLGGEIRIERSEEEFQKAGRLKCNLKKVPSQNSVSL